MSKDLMKVSFTKDCIADALEKLMEHRALKDISVDEITALAGVGRATYFRNFNSKYEVCAYKQIKEWVAYRDKYHLDLVREYSYDGTLLYFQFMYNKRAQLKRRYVYPSENLEIQRLTFERVFVPEKGNEYEDSYKIAFFSYGLIGLIQKWVENDFAETPEEMTAFTKKWFR